jgi:hypothetical protein
MSAQCAEIGLQTLYGEFSALPEETMTFHRPNLIVMLYSITAARVTIVADAWSG